MHDGCPPRGFRSRARAARMPEPTAGHMPSRPGWRCKAPGCGEAWPCSTQRAELLRTYRHARSPLRIYMASYMYDAIEDAVRYPLEGEIDLWNRFMGWVPQA